jgi:hypothetical protein
VIVPHLSFAFGETRYVLKDEFFHQEENTKVNRNIKTVKAFDIGV